MVAPFYTLTYEAIGYFRYQSLRHHKVIEVAGGVGSVEGVEGRVLWVQGGKDMQQSRFEDVLDSVAPGGVGHQGTVLEREGLVEVTGQTNVVAIVGEGAQPIL